MLLQNPILIDHSEQIKLTKIYSFDFVLRHLPPNFIELDDNSLCLQLHCKGFQIGDTSSDVEVMKAKADREKL